MSISTEDLHQLVFKLHEFKACIVCSASVQSDVIDQYGRCPDCSESSKLRLVE